jgi:3-isopropylmalate/(R)-2-methylmalate dehydratase small subunit
MEPFRVHNGLAAPLDSPNVDTDQIIPKQFLKRIERTGFGEFLFYDWRYTSDGKPDPSFILNAPRYKGATILLAGRNFGCGSSREHAPWALLDYGFRTIIASTFADIFYNNCLKNGILPVTLPEDKVNTLIKRATEIEGYRLTVDLEQREVSDDQGFRNSFELGDFQRYCLMEGLDDIGLSLQHEEKISAYEKKRPSWKESARSA